MMQAPDDAYGAITSNCDLPSCGWPGIRFCQISSMPNSRCVGTPPDCCVGSTLIHSLYQTCTPALMPNGRSRVSSEPLLGSLANSSWLSISDHVLPKSVDE